MDLLKEKSLRKSKNPQNSKQRAMKTKNKRLSMMVAKLFRFFSSSPLRRCRKEEETNGRNLRGS